MNVSDIRISVPRTLRRVKNLDLMHPPLPPSSSPSRGEEAVTGFPDVFPISLINIILRRGMSFSYHDRGIYPISLNGSNRSTAVPSPEGKEDQQGNVRVRPLLYTNKFVVNLFHPFRQSSVFQHLLLKADMIIRHRGSASCPCRP